MMVPQHGECCAGGGLWSYHRTMLLFATQVGLFAAELEARGFLRGVGRTILIVIVILVVLGGLIGFSVARRFGRRG